MIDATLQTTSSTKQQMIFTLLKEHIVQVIPELAGTPIEPTDTLKQLGADSMERVDILVMTIEKLSLKAPLIEFANTNSLGELAERIAVKLEQAHER